ncbi:MAG: hypothetical protein ACHQ6U_10800 [Thermodesulfobacteriota bacterium]
MSGEIEEDIEPERKRGALTFAAGVAAGVIITLVILSLSGAPNRYEIVSSQDGAVVHKIDTRTGRVWAKNSYEEIDAQGQPVTIWYWDEVSLDRPGAAKLAKELKVSMSDARKAEKDMLDREVKEKEELKKKRLDEIFNTCGDNAVCSSKKCAIGYKGAKDPEWSSYCAETLKTRIANGVIDRCGGDPGCIKSYCVNKYNNTYPAVSDCMSEINLVKVKNENAKSDAPGEGQSR